MKRIGRRAKILSVVLVYFLALTGVFLMEYARGASSWVVSPANQNIYKNGALICPGLVLSADGIRLFVSDKNGSRWAESKTLRQATLHSVGDAGDRINSGVVRNYKANFIGYDLPNGVFNPGEKETTITLTLNSALCRKAYEALGSRNGTIGVMNYKTGEILCMVSNPAFDPENVPSEAVLNSEAYEGVFINRLLGGLYVPGSIFKLITAAAAIDTIPDIDSRTFTCKGSISYGPDKLKCMGTHGKINFKQALAKSCNCAFAEIANELGKETLTQYAEKAGVLTRFDVSNVQTARGRLDLSKAAPAELGWAGIGQFTTLVNPMQYLIFMSAVANHGVPALPYYVTSVQTGGGLKQPLKPSGKAEPMLSEATADRLAALMRSNVAAQYGESGLKGHGFSGKTGTAETGDGAPHAWFAGFLQDEDAPLCFIAILEHSGSGTQNAIPVVRSTLQEAIKLLEKS